MFKEKIIVMTGAAGGIGSATARLFAQQGATLVLTDIAGEKLKELGEDLKNLGAETLQVEHNVTDPESWQSLLERVKKEYGKIDVLLNIAGIAQPGIAEGVSLDEVHDQVSINLLGTIYGCRAALGVMKKQGFGKIINIASLGGIIPLPGEAIYCATKFAVRGYSLALHAEYHNSPIEITVVCPDSVDTPQLDYELLHDEAVLSFIGEPLKPEKVAKGILKAARKKKSEILIPAGMGHICRIGMAAFPRIFFSLVPLLEKMGRKTIRKRREKKKQKEDGK
jgi:3-oxoacyl-[acyl-carrier protein] reductase